MNAAVVLIAALAAVALVVTKTVDFVRSVAGGWFEGVAAWVWIALSFVVGVAYCVGWGIDLSDGVLRLVPALAEVDFGPTAGTVLTGLATGAGADFWHKILKGMSSRTEERRAHAASFGT